jgi:hypothetical protein
MGRERKRERVKGEGEGSEGVGGREKGGRGWERAFFLPFPPLFSKGKEKRGLRA